MKVRLLKLSAFVQAMELMWHLSQPLTFLKLQRKMDWLQVLKLFQWLLAMVVWDPWRQVWFDIKQIQAFGLWKMKLETSKSSPCRNSNWSACRRSRRKCRLSWWPPHHDTPTPCDNQAVLGLGIWTGVAGISPWVEILLCTGSWYQDALVPSPL